MTRQLVSIAAASVLLSQAAFAAEAEPAWMTHTELSYINTQGNSETSSFALEAKAKKSWDAHALRATAAGYYSEDGGVESKNKWMTELNYDYGFSKRLSFNYLFGYVDDNFSGYNYQLYTGPGVGYKAIDTKAHKLDTQLNALFSKDELEDGTTDEYGAWKAGLDYSWQIQANLKFSQLLSVRGSFEDEENYFATSKTAIAAKINSTLSMGVSYKVDYVNLPPMGKEYTDRTFMTSLIIDY